jgi:hypothetical protein
MAGARGWLRTTNPSRREARTAATGSSPRDAGTYGGAVDVELCSVEDVEPGRSAHRDVDGHGAREGVGGEVRAEPEAVADRSCGALAGGGSSSK